MSWLLFLLRPFAKLFLTLGLQFAIDYWNDLKERRKKDAEAKAKLEASEAALKQELEKAGNDVQAQEDAIDRYLDSTRKL